MTTTVSFGTSSFHLLSSLPQSGQSRYFQVTRRAHEYNDFLLKNGTTTGLPSSGENTTIDTPPRQAPGPSLCYRTDRSRRL